MITRVYARRGPATYIHININKKNIYIYTYGNIYIHLLCLLLKRIYIYIHIYIYLDIYSVGTPRPYFTTGVGVKNDIHFARFRQMDPLFDA